MKRESLKLSDERKESLNQIATKLGCKNTRGTAAGKPSWRALIYAIADGAVKVTRSKKKG
jgi:hypothetical protein